MVPFEWVFPVPPLSLPDDEGKSDAVALFTERSVAAGWPVDTADRDRIIEVCRALDGVALAIELAVARLPVLGLDGLHAGMSNQLRLLAGGHRAHDRHSSVRDMLDWSHALLHDADQTLLRRAALFAAPFTPDAAAQVAGFLPSTRMPCTTVWLTWPSRACSASCQRQPVPGTALWRRSGNTAWNG